MNSGIKPVINLNCSKAEELFLHALNFLTEYPYRVKRLISNTGGANPSYYSVKFCDMGEWKEVILDNRFLSFDTLKLSANQFWIIVL
jgi:hypothetical protein